MKGMEKISEAILSKVRLEAENIIKEAEEKAREELKKAERQREAKLEAERRKMIEEAGREATRILAQASIKARQELSRTKADIINEIVGRVKHTLSGISSDENLLPNLIKEAVDGLGADKARIYVSPKNVRAVKKFLGADKGLASKIVEVKEFGCTGGVIAEDIAGKTRIDNTYDTRLEMLLPQILPQISKELFEGL